MTLELNKVAAQVDDMGRLLAQRARREAQALPAARELLRLFACQHALLQEVAESEAGQRLRCASPGPEALDIARPPTALPHEVTLVAADGSQIYPDYHGLAFYYLINIGTIVFRHGTGRAPAVATRPRLCYTDADVFPQGQPVSADWVGVVRALGEMRELSEVARSEAHDGVPCVGLADGPLLAWLRQADAARERQAQALAEYLGYLDLLRARDVPVAGFVSRPLSSEVVAVLYLAHLPPEERAGVESLAVTDYQGLADRSLFGFLHPGERSALFVRSGAENREFRARGHEVHFFYLSTGTDVARVEVPEWVAGAPASLDLVHSAVYDQCRANAGYPYVLTRADEEAVIHGAERRTLESMLVTALLRHEEALPELSSKARQKRVARWRRP